MYIIILSIKTSVNFDSTEQDSTMGPNFALMESCWGVPSPNRAIMKNGKQHDLGHALPDFAMLFYWTALCGEPLFV